MALYADDAVIYSSAKSPEKIEQHLTADWMENNDLVTNMKKGKTECMLFETNQHTKHASLWDITKNSSINRIYQIYFLGVTERDTISRLFTKQIRRKIRRRMKMVLIVMRMIECIDKKSTSPRLLDHDVHETQSFDR